MIRTITISVLIVLAAWAIAMQLVWVVKKYFPDSPKPCHSTGVTLLEYGVGVTNCGDTILVKMPVDLYKEFKEKRDDSDR